MNTEELKKKLEELTGIEVKDGLDYAKYIEDYEYFQSEYERYNREYEETKFNHVKRMCDEQLYSISCSMDSLKEEIKK